MNGAGSGARSRDAASPDRGQLAALADAGNRAVALRTGPALSRLIQVIVHPWLRG
jgi:hypothetical protein